MTLRVFAISDGGQPQSDDDSYPPGWDTGRGFTPGVYKGGGGGGAGSGGGKGSKGKKEKKGKKGKKKAAKTSTALRPVGKFLESVDDVLANPSLLKGQSYAQVRGMLNGSKGWVNSTMTKTRGVDKGWVFRQVNGKRQPTGRLIQYHPGSRRHFGRNPYWKVSDGANVFRFPAN